MKLLTPLLLVALLAGGCGGNAGTDSPVPTDGPGPPITAIFVDYEGSWSPAWSLPSTTGTELGSALQEAGISMLIPAVAPAVPAGTLSMDVRVTSRAPVGASGADIVVRRSDLSVYVSLGSLSVTQDPVCTTRLDDLFYPDWSTELVRGTTGCSMQADTLSYVAWTENGQNFVAEFPTAIGLEAMVTWFDTWVAVA
jgi:hypothetical protein